MKATLLHIKLNKITENGGSESNELSFGRWSFKAIYLNLHIMRRKKDDGPTDNEPVSQQIHQADDMN